MALRHERQRSFNCKRKAPEPDGDTVDEESDPKSDCPPVEANFDSAAHLDMDPATSGKNFTTAWKLGRDCMLLSLSLSLSLYLSLSLSLSPFSLPLCLVFLSVGRSPEVEALPSCVDDEWQDVLFAKEECHPRGQYVHWHGDLPYGPYLAAEALATLPAGLRLPVRAGRHEAGALGQKAERQTCLPRCLGAGGGERRRCPSCISFSR